MITGLAHVCFTVRDLDVSRDFYCNKLGLRPAFDFVNDKGVRHGMYVHAGGRNFIELFQGTLSPRAEGQAYRHLCLEVDDLDATAGELRRHGVEVSNVKVGSDHSRQGWIADPDGNRIELHEYTPKSKQTPWVT